MKFVFVIYSAASNISENLRFFPAISDDLS
jgi:hypothetical protein